MEMRVGKSASVSVLAFFNTSSQGEGGEQSGLCGDIGVKAKRG